MFFQQWTGVNAILYYAPSIFTDLGLTGNTISLLATGVVGIVYVATTQFALRSLTSRQHVPRDYSGCHLG